VNAAARGMPAAANGTDDRRALAFLAELSQALALSLDLRKTLSMALGRIADFMQAEAASMFLVDPATRLIECRLCVGPVDIAGLKVELGQGIVGRAVADNLTQIVRDAQTDARVNVRVDAETGFVTRSIICVPLTTSEGPIGALEVVNRRGGGLFDLTDAVLLETVAAPAALAINNARLAEGLVEQQRIRRELELARSVQKSLLPKRRRGNFPLIGINLPAHEISGDFYDYFDLPDGRLAFLIGDISGKGLDAAFLMVRVASLLRWVGKEAPEPAQWLARVNEELCETHWSASTIAATAASLSPAPVFHPRCCRTTRAFANFRPTGRRSASCPTSPTANAESSSERRHCICFPMVPPTRAMPPPSESAAPACAKCSCAIWRSRRSRACAR